MSPEDGHGARPAITAASPHLFALVEDLARDRDALVARLDALQWGLSEPTHSADPRLRAAFLAVTLHNAQGALESALEPVARVIDEDLPQGSRWHRDLLERMARPFGSLRPALSSAPTLAVARRLLGFRHFFRHAYAVALDLAELERHSTGLVAGRERLMGDLDAFGGLLKALTDASVSAV
jgi:hypothetical protein